MPVALPPGTPAGAASRADSRPRGRFVAGLGPSLAEAPGLFPAEWIG